MIWQRRLKRRRMRNKQMRKRSRMKMWMVYLWVLVMAAGFSACRPSQNDDSVPQVDEADEDLTLPAYEEE